MSWSAAYSVGVAFIDEEHRELLGLINNIHAKLHASASEDEIRTAFERLTDFTSTHFWHEEKEFEGTNYPRAAIHCRKHEHLKVILSCFQKGIDRTGQYISFEDQLDFLRDWLMEHIASEDKRLGEYLTAVPTQRLLPTR